MLCMEQPPRLVLDFDASRADFSPEAIITAADVGAGVSYSESARCLEASTRRRNVLFTRSITRSPYENETEIRSRTRDSGPTASQHE